MSEYTPSLDPERQDIREWYITGRRVHNPFASDAALIERFDRWLAEHDRVVAANAWDEGYAQGVRDNERDMEPADNPYRITEESD